MSSQSNNSNDSNSNSNSSNSNISTNNSNGYGRTVRDRRASFSVGSSLSDYLSSNRQPQPPSAYPSPIVTAAAQANHQRRMSMPGINGSPPHLQTGFLRRGSVSSVSSNVSGPDETAIDDSEPVSGSPTSPFARKMSWGARALREVRIPRGPLPPGSSSPTVSRGFWPETSNNTSAYPTDAAFQQRRQSMPAPPANAMPAPKEPVTDILQERMLRNEFYMD